jgi:hypothetical protein
MGRGGGGWRRAAAGGGALHFEHFFAIGSVFEEGAFPVKGRGLNNEVLFGLARGGWRGVRAAERDGMAACRDAAAGAG